MKQKRNQASSTITNLNSFIAPPPVSISWANIVSPYAAMRDDMRDFKQNTQATARRYDETTKRHD